MSNDLAGIVRELIRLRDQSGESLQTVASRAGMTRSGLWKIEHGVGDVQVSTLSHLAAAHGRRLTLRLEKR